MTTSSFAAAGRIQTVDGAEYRPGQCNIGPAEIRRRRTVGHVGLAASLGLLAALVAIDAPPLWRLLLAVPAALSASGYIQARLKFCAAYGERGVFSFGRAGDTTAVVDRAAAAADRRRARQIGLATFGIGLAVAVTAVLLPL